MSTGHLHLMLNHFPVLGAPFLLALLAYGLGGKLPEIIRVVLWCTVALGVITVVVYLTGEAAEEMVEALPTFDHDMVERHEEIALWATGVLVASAVLSGCTLWPWRRRGALPLTATRLVPLLGWERWRRQWPHGRGGPSAIRRSERLTAVQTVNVPWGWSGDDALVPLSGVVHSPRRASSELITSGCRPDFGDSELHPEPSPSSTCGSGTRPPGES